MYQPFIVVAAKRSTGFWDIFLYVSFSVSVSDFLVAATAVEGSTVWATIADRGTDVAATSTKSITPYSVCLVVSALSVSVKSFPVPNKTRFAHFVPTLVGTTAGRMTIGCA